MTEEPVVRIGEIVIVRTRDDVDVAAIVTQVLDDGHIHAQQFPPPGASALPVEHQWGIPPAPPDHTKLRGTWRRAGA